ncbi:hypothetical protein TNCT_264521 [Trichonephila clavata]|uniref:Uncharacterized protein n=1 Tax=Trichonephila clavata TaxID=2740835 RepID=A0A8X6KZI2_TRICU|nr:hypothetical protein TNCT_264521 [Trichonephila clavata]
MVSSSSAETASSGRSARICIMMLSGRPRGESAGRGVRPVFGMITATGDMPLKMDERNLAVVGMRSGTI